MSPPCRSLASVALLVAQLALTIQPAIASPARLPAADAAGRGGTTTAPPAPAFTGLRPSNPTAGPLASRFLMPGSWPRQEDPAGEEPDSAATDPAAEPEGEDAEPALHAPTMEPSKPQRRSWWVWTGTAALVGLFIAGLSHDLANDGQSEDEPETLPDFPNTP